MKKEKIGINITVSILIILVSVLLYFLIREEFFSTDIVANIEVYLSSYGIFAPLIYIVILALSIIVTQIPNVPLAIAAGMYFGPILGGIYSVIGGMLGALACFFIARSLGIRVIKKLFGKVPIFTDRCNENYIGLLIFLSRLFPFFSFDLISFCAGLTNIRIWTFFIATLFGMIPMTFLFTHLGNFIMLNHTISLILNISLLVVFFTVPFLIRKFNLFNLNEYIQFEK
jgi:uncharacterized membrane protein YdjX (TVP38/TMEM64 family)